VFGSVAVPMRNFPAAQRWRAVLPTLGRVPELAVDTLAPVEDTAALVDDYVSHRVRYEHEANDEWAPPAATLDRRRGDCEDMAILKMALLARCAVPLDSMALVVVADRRSQLFHAVLALATTGGTLIMDNRRPRPGPDAEIGYYQPLYSLSGDGRAWLHGVHHSAGV